MKAIILISSIFYLLGLFIGNQIDLVKKSIPPVEKIILHKIKEYNPSKTISFMKEKQKEDSDVTANDTKDTEPTSESKK